MKAIFRSFACDWGLQILVNMVVASFQFASPFLIIRLVAFIEAGSNQKEPETWESLKPGVILSAMLIGSQLLSYLISEHLVNW